VVQCPECGAENPDGSLYCGLCTYRFAGYLRTPPIVAACEAPLNPAAVREKFSSLDELHFERPRERGAVMIWTAGILAVIVLAILLFMALSSGGKNTEETLTGFVSTTSGLSFKYPVSWEKKTQEFLKTFEKGSIDPSQGNEVILIKQGDSVFRHLLIVSNSSISTGNDSWDVIKPQIEDTYEEAIEAQNTTVTFNDLHLDPSTGANGFKATYSLKPGMGPTLFQIEAYIVKGTSAYRFILITPLKGGGSNKTEAINRFTQITNSISFK
jgi:hypothetical protein